MMTLAAADTSSSLLERDLLQLAASHPALFLTVLTTILDDFRSVSEAAAVDDADDREEQEAIPQHSRHPATATIEQTRRFKDILKGYHHHHHDHNQQQAAAAIDNNSIGTSLCSRGSHFVHITAAATTTATTTRRRQQPQRPPAVAAARTAVRHGPLPVDRSFLSGKQRGALPGAAAVGRATDAAGPGRLNGAALRAWREWVTSCSTNSGSRQQQQQYE